MHSWTTRNTILLIIHVSLISALFRINNIYIFRNILYYSSILRAITSNIGRLLLIYLHGNIRVNGVKITFLGILGYVSFPPCKQLVLATQRALFEMVDVKTKRVSYESQNPFLTELYISTAQNFYTSVEFGHFKSKSISIFWFLITQSTLNRFLINLIWCHFQISADVSRRKTVLRHHFVHHPGSDVILQSGRQVALDESYELLDVNQLIFNHFHEAWKQSFSW